MFGYLDDNSFINEAKMLRVIACSIYDSEFLILRKLDNSFSAQEEVVNIKRIITHQGFNRVTFQNDIALIILNKHLELGGQVQAACLPTSEDIEGECFATGWGKLRYQGSQPNTLQEVQVYCSLYTRKVANIHVYFFIRNLSRVEGLQVS